MADNQARRIRANESGQLLPVYAAAMSLAILILAIMVDLGFMLMYRLELQQMAAGAAQAGSEYYDQASFQAGYDVVLDRPAAQDAARRQAQDAVDRMPGTSFEVQTSGREVKVTISRRYQPWWWPVADMKITAAESAAPLGVR